MSVATTSIYPDVSVIDAKREPSGEGGVAIAAPLRLPTVVPDRVPQVSDGNPRDGHAPLGYGDQGALADQQARGRTEGIPEKAAANPAQHIASTRDRPIAAGAERVPMQQRLPNAPYFVLLNRRRNGRSATFGRSTSAKHCPACRCRYCPAMPTCRSVCSRP